MEQQMLKTKKYLLLSSFDFLYYIKVTSIPNDYSDLIYNQTPIFSVEV